MVSKLHSITLKSLQPQWTRDFYTALGFEFSEVKIYRGSQILRSHCDGLEISLIAEEHSRQDHRPSLQLSFIVPELASVFKKLGQISGVVVLLEPTEMPEGLKAIVQDPEGHAVELIAPSSKP